MMTPKQKAEYIACKMRSAVEIAESYNLEPRNWGSATDHPKRCNQDYRIGDERKIHSTIVSCERVRGHKGFHADADCWVKDNSDHNAPCIIVWLKDAVLIKNY